VKTRAGKSDDEGSLRPGSDVAGKSVENHDPRDGPHQDQELVQRCLTGDVAAWENLYAQCHGPLLALVKGLLCSADAELVDEIAARVWYALVANDGALLLRFDPTRGTRLVTFLRAIARDEATRHFRTEVRRKERETVAARQKSADMESEAVPHFLMEEFLTTLSPGDRSFCLEHVLAPAPQDGVLPASRRPAVWQQTRRLYKKLQAFLGREF